MSRCDAENVRLAFDSMRTDPFSARRSAAVSTPSAGGGPTRRAPSAAARLPRIDSRKGTPFALARAGAPAVRNSNWSARHAASHDRPVPAARAEARSSSGPATLPLPSRRASPGSVLAR